MEQCVNTVVAFGLNQTELDLVKTLIFFLLVALAFRWIISYLNYGLESKEERWAKRNSFLSVDIDAEKRRACETKIYRRIGR